MALLNENDEASARDSLGGLTKVVVNILGLRGVTPPSLANTILVQYGSTLGDAGGGFFIWNPTDTTADDGATVIRPYSVPQANPGRWNLLTAQNLGSGASAIAGLGQGVRAMPVNGAILTTDRGKIVYSTGATAITMLNAATAGAGFVVAICNSASIDSAVVVVSGANFVTPYGNPLTSLALAGGESAILMSLGGGTSWFIIGGTNQAASRLTFRDTSLSNTIAANDRGKLIVATSNPGATITVPDTTDANIGDGFTFSVVNPSPTNIRTLTCATSLFQRPFGSGAIAGTTTLVLLPGESVTCYAKGGVWYVIGGSGTPVQARAFIPDVIALIDGATINTDASQGNDYTVTITGNRNFAAPTNPSNGQKILYAITQGGGGPWTPTFDVIFNFGTIVPTWSTTAAKVDMLLARYDSVRAKWDVLSFQPGY